MDILPVGIRRTGYRMAYVALRVWWLVRQPHLSGVKCVLTDGDHVLLVRHTYGDRRWDLPGGSIRRREEPIQAARREMLEELGVAIEDWRALGQIQLRMHRRHDTLHCFQAELARPVLEVEPAELEVAEWFPRGALPPERARLVNPVLERLARSTLP